MPQENIRDIFSYCNINLNLTKWLKFTSKFNFMTYNNEQNTTQKLWKERFLYVQYEKSVFPKAFFCNQRPNVIAKIIDYMIAFIMRACYICENMSTKLVQPTHTLTQTLA